jgi:probable F420-dependent oxidoreductase
MQFGVSMFFTDWAAPAAEVAREAEARGFESLFAPEHTHIPVSRLSPWPGGDQLPEHYWHTLDPFVSLASAATATTRLKVGTGICLVAQRDPVVLAKEVASVDHLSGGRFLFGIGAGWNREEAANHGTAWATRWELMAERVAAMRAIWSEDAPEFHGRFVDFDPIWQWPKPVQRPGPPVLLGGAFAKALQAVVDYADEWTPIYGRPDDFAGTLATLRRRAEEAGRGPIPVSVFQCPNDAATIERLGELGVSRCVFALPAAPLDQLLGILDACAATAALA